VGGGGRHLGGAVRLSQFHTAPQQQFLVEKDRQQQPQKDHDQQKHQQRVSSAHGQGRDPSWSIARKYGSSVAKIKSANGLKSDTIRDGRSLVIPR